MDELELKWGAIKGYNIKSESGKAALEKYENSVEVSWSVMIQDRSSPHVELLCELIDAIDNPEIYLSWDGRYVDKEQAKGYVSNYGKK